MRLVWSEVRKGRLSNPHKCDNCGTPVAGQSYERTVYVSVIRRSFHLEVYWEVHRCCQTWGCALM